MIICRHKADATDASVKNLRCYTAVFGREQVQYSQCEGYTAHAPQFKILEAHARFLRGTWSGKRELTQWQ